MGILLQPDEFELGMFVTIHSGKVEKKEYNTFQGPKTVEKEKQSHFKGKVLKIKAIDMPYIVVEYHISGMLPGDKKRTYIDTIDTRNFNLMSISKEFVIERDPLYKNDKFVVKQKNSWVFDQEIQK